ncbi:MAG: hypothetical protein V1859_02600 [archaeon]
MKSKVQKTKETQTKLSNYIDISGYIIDGCMLALLKSFKVSSG